MGISTNSVTRRRFVWLGATAAATLALGGCDGASHEVAPSATAFDEPADGEAAANGDAGSAQAEAQAAVAARVDAMTLEQKVAQLFVVAPEALVEGVSQVTRAGDATHEGVKAWPVGGIVYFAPNLTDPDQTTTMLSSVHGFYEEDSNVPPFLAVDEEGGSVARVASNEAFGVQDVGDASALGAAGDAAAAGQAAGQIAGYLKPLGFNLDFAPVCDVVDPLRSDTMGLRSFSSDAEVCAAMVKAEVRGFLDAGMLCCAKHFPGIGAAAGDSHTGAITIDKTADELAAVDLVPFKAAIEAGVPMIMVGHLNLPQVVGDDTPAPLASVVVQDMLRDTLGFTGIVVTDSLSMGAVTDRYSPAEAAVAALAAGCDVPLMPENFREAYQGVLDAVAAGTLTEERIDESVTRILLAKQQYIGL
ncbi:glycoside hydrolase family 3 N-terminal domain-containing protein [Adlercreutzia sp. R7]|uniref:beta-N-acetylhexosaminidase n=1 Tax=Adlercreutzia wanghongyangiae TaxID=3111451 RepID=A0ABU6IES1_9ACTN|nr:glycoside hydrolase family 3 N-terminal domain-containing protein [Adlercreutzia sp. R7]